MSDKVFIDTNIFLYAHSVSEEAKREAARALIFKHYADKTSVISTQVLAEFFQNYVVKMGGEYVDALKEMHFMCSGGVVEQSISLLLAGTKLWHQFSLSYWDALIVAAAIESGSDTLCTEDLQHGQIIEGVRIYNPFIQQ